jgi:hypothetical protein
MKCQKIQPRRFRIRISGKVLSFLHTGRMFDIQIIKGVLTCILERGYEYMSRARRGASGSLIEHLPGWAACASMNDLSVDQSAKGFILHTWFDLKWLGQIGSCRQPTYPEATRTRFTEGLIAGSLAGLTRRNAHFSLAMYFHEYTYTDA